MRRIAVLLAAVVVVGCGRPDPATGRLDPGTEAIAYNEKRDSIGVSDMPKGSGIALMDEGTFAVLKTGTKVRVISDLEETDDAPENRKVRVLILEGQYQGIPGSVERKALRPVPEK